MITLTRIRQNTPFILNPDLIERVDTHVDTVVRLTSGTEYVVNETGDEIVRRTAEFRARVLALAGTMNVRTEAVTPADAAPAVTPAAAPIPSPEVWAPADSGALGTASDPAIETSDEEAAL
jgi:flagellar protein FlbD